MRGCAVRRGVVGWLVCSRDGRLHGHLLRGLCPEHAARCRHAIDSRGVLGEHAGVVDGAAIAVVRDLCGGGGVGRGVRHHG
uniref:Uncharacterized protein n=1 Tax=Zea mays TaxID=4577 RepID=C4J4M6_MAIZE|nr:unknown [Zea mays]